jgi:hypothetical protein
MEPGSGMKTRMDTKNFHGRLDTTPTGPCYTSLDSQPRLFRYLLLGTDLFRARATREVRAGAFAPLAVTLRSLLGYAVAGCP